MLSTNNLDFICLFKELEDPRADEKITYPLDEIIFLVIAAVLSGAESWYAITRYGEKKLNLLRNFFPYINGVATRTTIMRLFSLFEKTNFESWLIRWSSSLLEKLDNELIAIDGKALKGARKHDTKTTPLYLLNAFATTQGLVIGQQAINEKTNEITAIPELLNNISIANSIISIDAIGCQKKIANVILEKNADYFLALKGNQKAFFSDVKDYFNYIDLNDKHNIDYFETIDKAHGRTEIRKCWSSSYVGWISSFYPDWNGINSICMIESERIIKGQSSIETRYYISSCESNAKRLLSYSRRHWLIENQLHWVLDVQLSEDNSHIRKKNAAENMGVIRKITLNLIKKYKNKYKDKASTSTIRLTAAWDNNIAHKILSGLIKCS